MVTTKRHLSTNIDYLLNQSNKWLSNIFEGDGAEIRQELEERKSKGELLIGSEGCEGFDPVKGCPGHPLPPQRSIN